MKMVKHISIQNTQDETFVLEDEKKGQTIMYQILIRLHSQLTGEKEDTVDNDSNDSDYKR